MATATVLITPLVRALVTAHAVPTGSPLRRACDRCHAPLLAWRSTAFAPPARCPACRGPVGAPAYLVEVAAVVVVVALVAVRRPVLETVAFSWWAVWALALVFVDGAVHRLPDRLTYPAAVGTVGLLGVAALVNSDGGAWRRAVVAAVICTVAFGLMTLILGGRGPGLGDAKLLLSTAAVLGWVSWTAVVGGLLIGLTAQALWAIALLITGRADRSTHLPLGPFLAGGALASLVLLG